MTLEKIRATLPTHIMLTPEVHRWREGDEFGFDWMAVPEGFIGGRIKDGFKGRRPIPPEVLDNQAIWIWVESVEGVASTPPIAEIVKAKLLESWRTLMQDGRLYDKWLLEQMEDV
jgi:hypothetical protein